MFQVLQMVQFVLVMVHAFQLLIQNDCDYPIYFAYFIGAHAVLFYFLFSRFYKQAYTKQKVSGRSQIIYDVWTKKNNQIKYVKIIYGQRLIKLCFFIDFRRLSPLPLLQTAKRMMMPPPSLPPPKQLLMTRNTIAWNSWTAKQTSTKTRLIQLEAVGAMLVRLIRRSSVVFHHSA